MYACCSSRYVKMLLKAVVLLVVLNYMVSPHPFMTDNAASDDTWPELEELLPHYKKNVPTDPSLNTPCPPLKLPQFQQIRSSDVHKLIFKPARNRRPVPALMRSILLPSLLPAIESPLPSKPRNIELLCHIDRIYVRVLKSIFISPDAGKYLKVGTCPVNKVTPEHYYFLYSIKSCNAQRHENENRVLYSNTLSYEPVTSEPIIRELAFSVPLECHYNKHFRSYSVGYHPQVEAGTVFLSLHGGVSLTPVDENWEPLATWQSYTIGQPMYFEAKAPQSYDRSRLYLSKCYVTATQNPDATLKYTVIDNFGCMVDSKINPQSKFYPSGKATLRFSLGALMFKDLVSQPTEKKEMFIHCEMHLGPEIPTPSTKACSYKADTQEWMELYGTESVCACCDASCPAPDPSVGMKMVSSSAWEVKNRQIDQPAQKSSETGEEALNHAEFELFWDKADETRA
ncbi:zona pellucida sperm-binding protein 3 [Pangasianodon hypophthalmus]|uniref:zona pellucida sperm-binding protein 3 n=1 Tax=Pangasianodon hypophthalmus TaxID=310915 RepID=UPI002306DDB8|nr:zona pellucida sperm-binding protein 3 [Pangasianodon hypophthalmus]